MDLMHTLAVAASGLRAQAGRMRVIAENLANADSTGNTPGAKPYRREIPTFAAHFDRAIGADTVRMTGVVPDESAFQRRLMPGHPAADAKGYVLFPNVNPLVEQMDLKEAQRSYEANLGVIGATRKMVARTLDILKA
jgi:flagellar basal-body rod protein FlgC